MSILFLMKPLATIDPKKDTSLLFMQAAEENHRSIYFLPQGGTSITPEGLVFNCQQITCSDTSTPVKVIKDCRLNANEVTTIFIRTDPPFDNAYLHDMWLLDHCPDHIQLINSPQGIYTVNEKIWATQFKSITPQTWVTQSIDQLTKLLHKHHQLIIKPTDSFGGQSIFKVSQTDPNYPVIFETMTNNNTTYVIAQQYIPDATNGDKRILLWDGNPLGAILRKHSQTDHRNNFFAGGTAHKASITTNDQHIIDTLKPHLQALKLRFVGIDIIGDKLIEVNVTSPTCLQELNALDQTAHHHTIIKQLT